MKKYISLLCIISICITCHEAKAQFAVNYPANTSLSMPHTVYGYTDTANGKIIINAWPYAGNIIINLFNISNGNYPCGISLPYPASNTFYLKDMYTGASYTQCFASGPTPDTIKYEIREASGTILSNIYFVIDPDAIPLQTNDFATKTIMISPNPANNTLLIDNIEKEYSASIIDLHGAVIVHNTLTKYNSKMDVSHMPAGFYFLKLTDEHQQSKVYKFAKE